VLQFENRYQHKDGTWRLLSWRSVPQPDGLMYATARDVTEAKRIEMEIHRLNADLHRHSAQLEAANKELEAFSYSVSHDLRAPLRHVQGYVDLLAREANDGLSPKGVRFLQTITDSARSMGQLIDDLLSFSRMGRAEMHETTVNFDRLLQETRKSLDLATVGRGIRWKISTLPAVQGDAAMLRQVWANLLGNAVKYTRKRDIAEIEIGRTGHEDGRIIFFVRDNGAGFDMRYAAKLFGVFQRLHHAEEFEGTGIGLANVRRIIVRHGGRTWAEGSPDAGATFYFTLKPAINDLEKNDET
jgi:light-regulated signal transduction histidine kinase (bacteriophytochrome)